MDKARYNVNAPATFVINLLSRRGFHLKGIIKGQHSLSFSIDASKRNQMEEVLNKQNISFSLLYIKGGSTKIKAGFKRYGLIAGSIIGLFFLTIYSLSLLSVRIEGLNNVEEGKILQVIEEEGIKFPSINQKIDTDGLTKSIMELDGVFGASVKKEGSVLIINVQEELSNGGIKDTQTPTPIVSEYDGIITRLVVLQGTALFKKGDTVKKGDVIIAPYITDANDNKIELKALGEVYATVWFQEHKLYSDTIISKQRTGVTETKTSVDIMGFKSTPKCSFESYEKEETHRLIRGIMPFILVTTTFYQTEDKEVAFDFENEKERLVEEETNNLITSLPNAAKGGKSWYIVKRLDNLTRLSVYYEVDMKITL